MSVLSPAVVASIDDLELAARIVVEGLRVGGHRSPFHGYGAEFKQHRPYRAGDDLRYLDWKVYARSDRLYTRQFLETTNVSVMIVLDASASMAFPEHGLSKFRYASIIAAALSYLVAEQGNAIGLMTMSGKDLAYVPARGGRVHLRSLLAKLDKLEPNATWQSEAVISRSAELLQRRGVVIVISDFYDAEDETRRAMRRVVQQGHDVAMLQVVSPEELKLPFREQVEFKDLETGVRRLIDPVSIESQYRSTMNAFLERCRSEANRDGIDYSLFPTDQAPERTLREYLLRRNAQHTAPEHTSAQ